MSLCPAARCGCSFESATLEVSRSSSGLVTIEMPDAYADAWPVFTFLNAAERASEIPAPEEGMESWLRASDDKWRHDGTDWRLIKKSGTWTPSLTVWALGSGGTIVGRYSRIEDTVDFSVFLTLGTGFTVGASPLVGLPFTAVDTSQPYQEIVNVQYHDSGANVYTGNGTLNGSFVLLTVPLASGTYISTLTALSTTVPFTWVAGDQVVINGSYICDITDSTPA